MLAPDFAFPPGYFCLHLRRRADWPDERHLCVARPMRKGRERKLDERRRKGQVIK